MPLRAFITIAVFVAALVVLNRTPSRAEDFDHAGLAREFVEGHLRPGYERLREKTSSFADKAEAFCGSQETADLTALREAFGEAALAWSAVSHIRFGPAMDEHRHARMLYWPDRKSLGLRQIRRALAKRDKSVLSVATLAEKSVAMQGLGAIEQILYWKAEDALAKPGETHTHRCGYLLAATKNLAGIAEQLNTAWSQEAAFTQSFLNPGPDNARYLEPSEVTLEIAKSFIVGLERLRDVKVAGSLGLRPNSRAIVRLPFGPSGLSTRAVQADLEGLIDQFENAGLRQRIEKHEAGMGKAIAFDLEQALMSLKQISLPIAEAIEDRKIEDELIATGFPLKNAREQATRVLAEAAGLSLGFNALDGD